MGTRTIVRQEFYGEQDMAADAKKRRVEVVTRERLSKRDHYRLQVNLDRPTVAFGYYALVSHYGDQVSAVRNLLQSELESSLKAYIARQLADDSDFAASISNYVEAHVDASDRDLQAEAIQFFRDLGWKPT